MNRINIPIMILYCEKSLLIVVPISELTSMPFCFSSADNLSIQLVFTRYLPIERSISFLLLSILNGSIRISVLLVKNPYIFTSLPTGADEYTVFSDEGIPAAVSMSKKFSSFIVLK